MILYDYSTILIPGHQKRILATTNSESSESNAIITRHHSTTGKMQVTPLS